MPTERHTPTLAETVHAAGEVADPTGADDRVTQFMIRFEDRDEPVTTVQDTVQDELAEAQRSIDPEYDSEALSTAVAVATYLAFRRDEFGADPQELIRLARRAEGA
jgi:hypothetical protein